MPLDEAKPAVPTPDRPPLVISEAAVRVAALAMTRAHHGSEETDTGGYRELARSIVGAIAAPHQPGLWQGAGPPVGPAQSPPTAV